MVAAISAAVRGDFEAVTVKKGQATYRLNVLLLLLLS